MSLSKTKRIWISAFVLLLAFILMRTIGYRPLTIVLMLFVTAFAGIPVFKRAFVALKYKIVGIDALVTIAVLGATVIGEYWEGAAVTFLFMLGDYLESRTIDKTRSSIRSLLDLAPDVARVRRKGIDEEISPEDVVKGDLVVVKQGERIAVDGTIVEGTSYVNQAAITGESMPLPKTVDETVFSGTVIESGYLLIRADRVGEDTTFARILHMVEEAQDKKAKTQKFLERFSKYYTPGIIILALVLYLVTRDIVLSLTLLVIACPGALVISTPVSIVAGIGNGAKHGVLIKGGEIMEKLGTVKVVAFDKTGTLTEGKPGVTGVRSYGISEEEVIKLAGIGEAYSEHPLAKAILKKAQEIHGPLTDFPESSDIITGQGLAFSYRGKDYLLGNMKLFADKKLDLESFQDYIKSEEEKGQTVVILGTKEELYGIISIADRLREESANLVKELKKQGLKKVVMLTGDNERAAKAIAETAGLDSYYSQLLPEDKVRVLKGLQETYGRAVMVGDGVNDAPALATADLGIAVGGVGSDVAMETADVVLMSEEIGKLSYAIGLSRATVVNMKQNITFALIVAAFLLAGVLIKTVNLSIGMLVHELSVILVVINAIRLLAYGNKKEGRRR